MTALSDEELMKHYLQWPRTAAMTPRRFRETLDAVSLFIDFDQTMVHYANHETDDMFLGLELFPTILGIPTHDFLAQEPYIIQTWRTMCDWNELLWAFCVSLNPPLPIPEMVIYAPKFTIPKELVTEYRHGKDFETLGVTNKTIVDDMAPHEIHAPGCLVFRVVQNRSK